MLLVIVTVPKCTPSEEETSGSLCNKDGWRDLLHSSQAKLPSLNRQKPKCTPSEEETSGSLCNKDGWRDLLHSSQAKLPSLNREKLCRLVRVYVSGNHNSSASSDLWVLQQQFCNLTNTMPLSTAVLSISTRVKARAG
ncbi:hypothetical protein POM88_043777 [Heracleum sosnowskyi]|uniref:Uncharacterized protein n=1 Tax=Heracleum sosnowskyi TaxID=360622 RepID=A0AAD8H314_9APIA|nr:hypothetical protein POM88_043777 [Heracleum sosnowskyi]